MINSSKWGQNTQFIKSIKAIETLVRPSGITYTKLE